LGVAAARKRESFKGRWFVEQQTWPTERASRRAVLTSRSLGSHAPYESAISSRWRGRPRSVPTERPSAWATPKAQARRCFEISRAALEQLGAGLKDVIRTRILLTRIEDWKAVAEVHGEFFRDVRPVNTIVQVSGFIDPDWRIETEIDAVLADG
jgi:Endoribonuclease L-PSP